MAIKEKKKVWHWKKASAILPSGFVLVQVNGSHTYVMNTNENEISLRIKVKFFSFFPFYSSR